MVTSLLKLSKGNNFLAKCLTMCGDSLIFCQKGMRLSLMLLRLEAEGPLC